MTFLNKRSLIPTIIILTLAIYGRANAVTYSYELSVDKTWMDAGTSSTTTNYVSVRSYVPGNKSVTYKTVPVNTSTFTSETNSSGDFVGSIFRIYGSGTTSFVDPFDGPKRTVVYPALQILSTRLFTVNDDRLALGTYHVLGGDGKGFIYDVIYDQYTQFIAPDTEWTDVGGMNNLGQIVGTSINDNGASRKGFTYDCEAGFEVFDIPGSSWTVPKKIDDDGNIYGIVTGLGDETYFIARPDTVPSNLSCSLVPRDDIAEAIVFGAGTGFELSGDNALGVKIGDFDGRGVNDLLIYHETGKTILYLGEEGFDEKIKYYGDEFNTLAEGVDIATEWDFNNDGLIDKIENNGSHNLLYFAKEDGSYYYVPQKLSGGSLKFGDLNGDGLVDYATFSGGFASIAFQTDPVTAVPEPVVNPEPLVDPEPVTSPEPVDTENVPAIDVNAYKIETVDSVAQIRENNVLLASGKTLWFNSETIIKFNDASGFEVGQILEFKAWNNPDGDLIAIKVEVA